MALRFGCISSAFGALALTLVLGRVGLAQPTQTDPAKLAEAKQHMEAGAAFYNDPSGHKCEEAYREFAKAYELSGSLNALKGMGVCALELERDGEAIEHFEKYLAGKGSQIDAADKTQVENDLKALKAAVAWVTFKANRPGTRVTDVRTPSRGAPITNRYVVGSEGLKRGMHPGAHVFTAISEGLPDVVWRVDIANGGNYEHLFEFSEPQSTSSATPTKGSQLVSPTSNAVPRDAAQSAQPDEATERPVPASVFVFGGLTVALAVPMTIFMLKASSDKKDYDSQNNGTLPQAEIEDLRSKVTTTNLIADIFLGATAASLVTTGVLFLTRPSQPAKQTAWSVVPVVGKGSGFALVTGQF